MNNYYLHIARKPIIVYKLVIGLDKNKCYSSFRNFIYFFNKEYTLKKLDKDFNPCIIVNGKIEKFRTLHIVPKYFCCFATIKALRHYLHINHIPLATVNIAVCIVPKDALYYSRNRCVLSDKIIIKHILNIRKI